MWYKLLLILGVACNVIAQLLLKHGMRGLDILFSEYTWSSKARAMAFNPFFWGALISYGVGFVFYSVVLSKLTLNVAYPVASVLAIVVIYLFSVFYFNEAVYWFNIAGVILCITGILLLLK